MQNLPQPQVFANDLTDSEKTVINELVQSTKQYPAQLQQLAIDASHLLSNSEQRLMEQQNTGFFKRVIHKFTGKQSENTRQNQADIINMQKYAWYYLQELQRQNLIAGKSIAVIRNNLITVNDAIIETREFLEEAIDKITARLEKVESRTELLAWAMDKDAEKRKYKVIPQTIKTLLITYDFIKSNYKHIQNYRDMNAVFATLDKLGIDLEEEISLNEFISQLLDEIEVFGGIENYHNIIQLNFDEYAISGQYLQDNIAGSGVNALYYLLDNYDKITDILNDIEESHRENFIAKLFGNEFGHLSELYTIEELVFEIIGGSLTAIDLYKEQHKIVDTNDGLYYIENDTHQNTLTSLLTLPEIKEHSWLSQQKDKVHALKYLQLLAFCCDKNSANSIGFLSQLIEIADINDNTQSILDNLGERSRIIANPSELAELLPTNDDKYTLIADMMFLSYLSGMELQNKFIGVIANQTKPENFREYFLLLSEFIQNSEQGKDEIINTIAKINQVSKCWKNIILYKEMSFEDYFSNISSQFSSNSLKITMLSMNLSSLSLKTIDCMSFGDENWATRKIIEVSRNSCLSDLNKEKNKIKDELSNSSSEIYQVSSLCRKFGLPTIEYSHSLYSSDFKLESSASNTDWDNQFQTYYDQINQAIDNFNKAVELSEAQLELFEQGKFDVSIIDIKNQEKAEREESLHQEKLSKQSVKIDINGEKKELKISWQDTVGFPFKLDEIRNIISNRTTWAVLDYNENVYISSDGMEWHHVMGSFNKIKYADGLFYFFSKENFLVLNEEGQKITGLRPNLLQDSDYSETDDLVKYGNKWLWRITKRTNYKYTKKGIIWGSEKENWYYKSIILEANSLDGDWRVWSEMPKLPDGVQIEKFAILPNSDIAMIFCKYDFSYVRHKKMGDKSNFAHYFNGDKWKQAEWNSDDINYIRDDLYFKEFNGQYYCYNGGNVYTSQKGYVWERLKDYRNISQCFEIDESLFLFTSWGNECYISSNLQEYKELVLEDGGWHYFTPNGKQVLAVYEPNRHESFLRLGTVIVD